jgi:hypothetical protein
MSDRNLRELAVTTASNRTKERVEKVESSLPAQDLIPFDLQGCLTVRAGSLRFTLPLLAP